LPVTQWAESTAALIGEMLRTGLAERAEGAAKSGVIALRTVFTEARVR
jgi:hypothetical protein